MATPQRAYSDEGGGGSGGGHWFGMRKSVLFIIILLILALSGLPQKIYYEYVAYKHKKIKDYLDVRKEYILFDIEEISPLLASVEITPDKEIYDLQVRFIEHKHAIKQLTPPKSLQTFHNLLIENVDVTEKVLAEAIQVKKGNVQSYNELVANNNLLKDKLKSELRDVFSKNNINYVETDDGLIEYEILLSDFSNKPKIQKEREVFLERWDNHHNDK